MKEVHLMCRRLFRFVLSNSNMAFHLSCFLVLTGFTGMHCITTVSEVTAKTGGSITIPCQYDSQYKNHVKYLCVGPNWNNCKYAVTTNQHRSESYSIYDNKNQQIFNVTIENLKSSDTNYYWCVVEINNWGDHGKYFHLSVTDTPSLSVGHQEMRGFEGGNITIKCFPKSGDMRWCRLGGSCVTSGSMNGATVMLNHDPNGSFVTMSGLKMESSGWYWCAKGDLQTPVHVTVSEPVITTTSPLATTSNYLKSVNVTTIFADKTTTTSQGDPNRPSFEQWQIYIILLGLLIFIVISALLILFMVKRRKHAGAKSSATVEDEVTYTTVVSKKRTQGQRSDTVSDMDVTYSTVVAVNR